MKYLKSKKKLVALGHCFVPLLCAIALCHTLLPYLIDLFYRLSQRHFKKYFETKNDLGKVIKHKFILAATVASASSH
jgi:hypothetical protein